MEEAKVRLRQAIDGPMPLTLALEVIKQVARALAAAEACVVLISQFQHCINC
jgi:hypothetical protein